MGTYETYDVYLGTSPSPPYWGNVPVRCDPPSLAANTTYYWRVVAVNASGAASSPVWSFTTSPQTLYTISRIAGGSQEGFAGDGGPATQALLNYPADIQLDAKGDIYVADRGNHRVRMIAANGVISTIAGSGSATYSGDGGPAVNAGVPEPTGLAMDSRGNLYISDEEYGCVRMVTPDGTISTVVGVCQLPSSTIFAGAGLAVDSQDNLYFASSACVGKMAGGVMSVVAGQCGVSPDDPSGGYGDGGPATSAILSYGIEGIALDAAGNLYIADNGHGSLREVSNGIITTVARGSMVWIAPGPGGTFYYTDAFLSVYQIAAGGAAIDIAGSGNGASPGTGAVAALSASLYYTQGIRVGSAGRIYFADSAGVYVLTPVSGNPGPTLAANNVWNAAGFGGAALAPGSIATVSGGFSLPTASQAAGLPLPTALSGLSLQFETGTGIAAPLFYASVGQAILQIPWETAGLSTVPLSASLNGNTGPAAVIPIAPFGPGIFTMNGTSTGKAPSSTRGTNSPIHRARQRQAR